METLSQRLEEQKERHEGGTKWIGTAEPRRSGRTATIPKACASARTGRRNRRAVKVWDLREFANLDDKVELGTRNIKIALRKLGASRGAGRRRSWRSPPPSTPPRARAAGSTSTWCPSGTTW